MASFCSREPSDSPGRKPGRQGLTPLGHDGEGLRRPARRGVSRKLRKGRVQREQRAPDYDDNQNGTMTCKVARRHGIVPSQCPARESSLGGRLAKSATLVQSPCDPVDDLLPLLARDLGKRSVADKAAPKDNIGFRVSQSGAHGIRMGIVPRSCPISPMMDTGCRCTEHHHFPLRADAESHDAIPRQLRPRGIQSWRFYGRFRTWRELPAAHEGISTREPSAAGLHHC